MVFKKLDPLEIDNKGSVYKIIPEEVPLSRLDDIKFITRNPGTISGKGHNHDYTEMFYLMRGKAEVTIGDETRLIDSPHFMIAYPNTPHQFKALSEITLIEYVFKN